MIEKEIKINGIEYIRRNLFKGKKAIYIEYRNEELRKIKFLQINNMDTVEVEDKEDLMDAVQNNYITDETCYNMEE